MQRERRRFHLHQSSSHWRRHWQQSSLTLSLSLFWLTKENVSFTQVGTCLHILSNLFIIANVNATVKSARARGDDGNERLEVEVNVQSVTGKQTDRQTLPLESVLITFEVAVVSFFSIDDHLVLPTMYLHLVPLLCLVGIEPLI